METKDTIILGEIYKHRVHGIKLRPIEFDGDKKVICECIDRKRFMENHSSFLIASLLKIDEVDYAWEKQRGTIGIINIFKYL